MRVIRVSCALALAISGLAQEQGIRCPALQDTVNSALANRVKTRYQAEPSAVVQLIDDSLVAGSCYHRLIFEVQSGQRAYTLPLYLSPDQRYLTRDLTEVRVSTAAMTQPAAPPPTVASVSPAVLAEGARTALGPAGLRRRWSSFRIFSVLIASGRLSG